MEMDKKQWYELLGKENKEINSVKDMINEGVLSQVNSEINKYKKQLEAKWKSKGAYENFGQKEVRKLEDKYIDRSDHSDEMKQIENVILLFDEWAMNYTG